MQESEEDSEAESPEKASLRRNRRYSPLSSPAKDSMNATWHTGQIPVGGDGGGDGGDDYDGIVIIIIPPETQVRHQLVVMPPPVDQLSVDWW